jgi:glutathione S-transferase
MDTLYAVSGTSSFVAALLLEECEHPYTLELMALYPNGAGTADYANVNPWKQVPALVTERGLITEVIAIAHYLDHVHPERALIPLDPWQRIQMQRWYSCLSTAIQPYVRCVVRPERFVGDDPARVRILGEHVGRIIFEKLALINDELGTRQWFVGHEFGPVDALLTTIMSWAERMRLPVKNLSHLQAHSERCRERPAFARAVERHGIVPNIVRSGSVQVATGVA